MKFTASIIAATVLMLLSTTAKTAETEANTLRFKVLLDDTPIGTHNFRITGDRSYRTVETRADFKVSLFFIPVFLYDHDNTEVWTEGCLQGLDSETNSNGQTFRVSLDRSVNGYSITTLDDSSEHLSTCLSSFAYWDPAFLGQSRLLNSQTGKLIDIAVEELGKINLEWLPIDTEVEGFAILAESDGIDIRVFYDKDDRWVGLESRLENGRLMRYLPNFDPA
jgi:hypothetical protein